MDVYESGSAVTLVIPFEMNQAITQSSYRVLDERRVELVGETAISLDGGATEAEVTVPAPINTLSEGVRRAIHTVELVLTLEGGSIRKVRASYGIAGETGLRVPEESFQTLAEAHNTAFDLPMMSGWSSATDAVKTTALMQAYHNISLLNFDLDHVTEFPDFPALEGYTLRPDPFVHMTREEFDALPDSFSRALRRAQVVEANDLLGGDPVAQKRQQGVLKETVGESSTTFVATVATRTTVCSSAKKILARFLSTGIRLRRS